MDARAETAALRLLLFRSGYPPIPVEGKRPAPKAWEQKVQTNAGEIELWGKVYPTALNTGVLTRLMPTVDIDIKMLDAAEAVEQLVNSRFEERGYILVRIGEAPKRAIIFRTEAPFPKITANLTAPNGSTEKIELLCDGQQVVCFGIHPGTGRPYSWHGGEPGKIPWGDLPYIAPEEALRLVNDAADLLVSQFGYERQGGRPKHEGGNGHDQKGAPADWAWLLDNIHNGRELHDSTVALAAKLIASGMGEGAAVNFLRAAFDRSTALRDDRWRERYDEIPRSVRSARNKYEGKPEQPKPEPKKGPITVRSKRGFMDDFVPLHYQIDGITQHRFIYAVTGKTGDAKTAVALLIATLVGSADPVPYLAGHRVEKGRVIYIVGENPDDVRMRVIGMDYKRGGDCSTDNIWFIAGIFEIEKMIQAIEADIKQNGEVSLVIVDTSAAYFFGNEELSNTQMGAYARLLRKLTALPGGPCVLILCHPIKHAAEQSQLLPRGGGAFLAEMDGNLTLWRRSDDVVELHWTGKFRGPDFRPICFRLDPIKDAPRLKDSKNRQMTTVQAVAMTQQEAEGQSKEAHSDQDHVLTAMLKNPDGALREWAEQIGWRYNDGNPNHKKVERILTSLLNEKGPKLVRQERGGHWLLTDAGKEEARPIATQQWHQHHPMQERMALGDG